MDSQQVAVAVESFRGSRLEEWLAQVKISKSGREIKELEEVL